MPRPDLDKAEAFAGVVGSDPMPTNRADIYMLSELVQMLVAYVRELEESENELLEQDQRNLAEMTELAGQRDRAREIAVELEQQLGQVRKLHPSIKSPNGAFCGADSEPWPCDTILTLNGGDQK